MQIIKPAQKYLQSIVEDRKSFVVYLVFIAILFVLAMYGLIQHFQDNLEGYNRDKDTMY